MLCECCGRNMLEGYIPTTGIWWIPKSGEERWLHEKGMEGVSLERTTRIEHEPAYYCPNCDRIVIDCKEIVK